MTLTQRLMGDPDPNRIAKSEALRARLRPPPAFSVGPKISNPQAKWRQRA
jgi:hypothetical protein